MMNPIAKVSSQYDPAANMLTMMKFGLMKKIAGGSSSSSAMNSRAGSRRSSLSVVGANNADAASEKKPDVCLVPTPIDHLQKGACMLDR